MMFSCIFHRSSQCRLVLMASSFVFLFMLTGLSSVRNVKSDQEKGRMQYASDQKVASLGKKLWCFKCFEKEDDQRNDSYSDSSFDVDPITPVSTPTLRLTGAFTPTNDSSFDVDSIIASSTSTLGLTTAASMSTLGLTAASMSTLGFTASCASTPIPASTPMSTPRSTPTLTPLSTPTSTPRSTPIMKHKGIQTNATDGAVE